MNDDDEKSGALRVSVRFVGSEILVDNVLPALLAIELVDD